MFTRALLFVTLHLLFWCLIMLVQEVEEGEGRIPKRSVSKTKPFRYLQDWYTATWGDWVGLSLVVAVAGYVYTTAHLPFVAVATLVGFVGTIVFHLWGMDERHRPDSGYPTAGTMSHSGALHLFYFFAQASVGAYVAVLALTGLLQGVPLYLAAVGGAVYMLSFLYDIHTGKFALLKK